jgi:translation elongation factor EF-Tu-like GTPase
LQPAGTGHDDRVLIDSAAEDFVLTIVDVFRITGRGAAVIGPIESGVIRTGDMVEIWEDDELIASTRATVEMINSRRADPRSIAVMLGDID